MTGTVLILMREKERETVNVVERETKKDASKTETGTDQRTNWTDGWPRGVGERLP